MAQVDDNDDASRDASTPRDTGTLGKLMVLLDLVTHSDAPLRFTDILALAGQPRGTLHRQLGHLVEEGLLEIDAEGRYAPGLRLLDLASRSWARNEFRLIAAPHLAALHRETGETVHLGVLRGSSIIYLDKVEGHQPVRMYSQIGNASPCYCTGVGKAALSVLTADKLSELLRSLHFNRFTSATHMNAETLLAEIRDIVSVGHAYDREEHEAGIRCVAAPIWSDDRSFIGGVSVTGPAYRLSMELLQAWAVPVQMTARKIMDEMRIRLGPRR
ncbi:DNA-binding IclR family transcriptional regulator [Rhizobium sp. BK529]|uniref:IclR family transcriptional regulator n=1 Tax=unclassified Rhizobium TaxID=2613769 RepID=UPI0018511D9B|nr:MULTISPECIES: IclR family transcriptional regulator [unclassified Rhizobium]MBB3592319.1 DNA-binding IclR family transcriptional regulator [Rhizobium sp. BK529]